MDSITGPPTGSVLVDEIAQVLENATRRAYDGVCVAHVSAAGCNRGLVGLVFAWRELLEAVNAERLYLVPISNRLYDELDTIKATAECNPDELRWVEMFHAKARLYEQLRDRRVKMGKAHEGVLYVMQKTRATNFTVFVAIQDLGFEGILP